MNCLRFGSSELLSEPEVVSPIPICAASHGGRPERLGPLEHEVPKKPVPVFLKTYRRNSMRLLSSAIREGEPIPKRFTCEGENISPEFYWEDAPRETKAFVLILHDPDAPRNDGFTHWLLYNISPNVTRISEDVSKQGPVAGLQGK